MVKLTRSCRGTKWLVYPSTSRSNCKYKLELQTLQQVFFPPLCDLALLVSYLCIEVHWYLFTDWPLFDWLGSDWGTWSSNPFCLFSSSGTSNSCRWCLSCQDGTLCEDLQNIASICCSDLHPWIHLRGSYKLPCALLLWMPSCTSHVSFTSPRHVGLQRYRDKGLAQVEFRGVIII